VKAHPELGDRIWRYSGILYEINTVHSEDDGCLWKIIDALLSSLAGRQIMRAPPDSDGNV
jgi:hypothetical protein